MKNYKQFYVVEADDSINVYKNLESLPSINDFVPSIHVVDIQALDDATQLIKNLTVALEECKVQRNTLIDALSKKGANYTKTSVYPGNKKAAAAVMAIKNYDKMLEIIINNKAS